MTGYEKYIKDVQSGKVIASTYIKQAVERFERFRQRNDIYFDADAVEKCITFIANMKHFKGKSAGTHFILSPWQQFIVACIIGLKWKSTGYRVCREVYLQVARKAGKDALIAAISLYCLIADGEASPEIACLANSREQSMILFEYIDKFAKSLDPKEDVIKHFKKYVEFPKNNGVCKTYSADSSKLDGLNISLAIIDEWHEAKDLGLYNVMVSSQGMRTQPLMIIITTAGFNLESPCHDKFNLAIEILSGVKTDDTFFPFLYVLDVADDWTDERNWEKCQPNLDITVTREFMRNEVQKAKNDSTALNGILTKTFNMWVSSINAWIPMETVVKKMEVVDLEQFRGSMVYLGVDLASVSDFTSLSVMIPYGEKFYFKTWTYIPEETYNKTDKKELYDKFIKEGSMIITVGNCTDYDYILSKIKELSQMFVIHSVNMDTWNGTYFQIKCTEEGFNTVPISQSIGNFNAPTKHMEKLILEGNAVIDKSSNVLWQFGNVSMKYDHNGNMKPDKSSYSKKIDSVISMIECVAGYLKSPLDTTEIFFI